MNPLDVSPGNIWEYRQNKPRLVCRDMWALFGVPQKATAEILMARGVYKWLRVRSLLIALKDLWRDQLTAAYRDIEAGKIQRGTPEYWQEVGRIHALEECRLQVRALCHSPRWAAPEDKDMALLDAAPEQ